MCVSLYIHIYICIKLSFTLILFKYSYKVFWYGLLPLLYHPFIFFFLPTHAFRLFSFCYLPRKFFLMYLIAILLVT